jgi:hypothetical protein
MSPLQTFPRTSRGKTILKRNLQVANSKADNVNGITLAPSLMTALAGQSEVDFSIPDFSTVLAQLRQIAIAADSGTHRLFDAAAARAALDAAAVCADVGFYSGDSTGRSEYSSVNDVGVHTDLMVYPSGGVAGHAELSGRYASASIPFGSTLSPTSPNVIYNTQAVQLTGSFSKVTSSFAGFGVYYNPDDHNRSVLIDLLARNASVGVGASRQFMGLSENARMVWHVFSNGRFWGTLFDDLSHTSAVVAGTLGDNDGSIEVFDSENSYLWFDAHFAPPFQARVHVYVGNLLNDLGWITMDGCSR